MRVRFPSFRGMYRALFIKKGGVTEGGGVPHPGERYNVCPQWCCDTRTVTRVRATSSSLLRDDQNLRDNRVAVQWRRAGCRESLYRQPDVTRMSFPRVKVPPL